MLTIAKLRLNFATQKLTLLRISHYAGIISKNAEIRLMPKNFSHRAKVNLRLAKKQLKIRIRFHCVKKEELHAMKRVIGYLTAPFLLERKLLAILTTKVIQASQLERLR